MKLWAVVEDGVINTSFEDDPSYFGELVALYETQEQAQAHTPLNWFCVIKFLLARLIR